MADHPRRADWLEGGGAIGMGIWVNYYPLPSHWPGGRPTSRRREVAHRSPVFVSFARLVNYRGSSVGPSGWVSRTTVVIYLLIQVQ